MTSPVRVLHVLGSLERGGVETWLMELLPHLDRSRWQFDFCTLGQDPGRYAPLVESCGSGVLPCPRGASFAARFLRILRDRGYQVVHSHVHHFSAFILAIAGIAGIPVRIGHSHNTSDGRANTLWRALYRDVSARLLRSVATTAVACSRPAAEALFGHDPRVRVLHYGISRLRPRPARQIAHRAPVVGHVGRFEPQKNHTFLLDVASVLRCRRPEIRWLLVGDGSLRMETEQRARRMGLEDTMIFCGLREDARDLMAGAMDLLLLPSLHEGLPLVLLEAQAAGLRSIVSSRVPREAAVVRGAVDFLPLEAGPVLWAERIAASVDRGRLPAAEAAEQLDSAGFTIEHSLQQLLEAYRC